MFIDKIKFFLFFFMVSCGGFSANQTQPKEAISNYEIWVASSMVDSGSNNIENRFIKGGIAVSQNLGQSFERPLLPSSNETKHVSNAVYSKNGSIVAFTIEGFLLRLGSSLNNWTPVIIYDSVLPSFHSPYFPQDVSVKDQYVSISTANLILFSSNLGSTWKVVTTEKAFPNWDNVALEIFLWDDTLFAHNGMQLVKTTDEGSTWTNIDPLKNILQSWIRRDYSFASNSNTFFAKTKTYGVYTTQDSGLTWKKLNLGRQQANEEKLLDISVEDQRIAISSNLGLYVSNNEGDSFRFIAKRGNMLCEKPPSGAISISDNIIAYANGDEGVCISTDFGNTWIVKTSLDGIPSDSVTHVEIIKSKSL